MLLRVASGHDLVDHEHQGLCTFIKQVHAGIRKGFFSSSQSTNNMRACLFVKISPPFVPESAAPHLLSGKNVYTHACMHACLRPDSSDTTI